MTLKRVWISSIFAVALLASYGCASKSVPLPSYDEFVQARKDVLPPSVVEIYGRYSAHSSGKTFRSSFNMLLEPGKAGYLEILGASSQMQNAVSLDPQNLTLLWPGDGSYLKEPSTPASLNAVIGLPLLPDDLLMAIGGYGINFSEWQTTGQQKDGWTLQREKFQTTLTIGEHISRIRIKHEGDQEAVIQYDDYKMIDNRLLPHRIRVEVPARKIALELKAEKFVFRDQPSTPDLFDVDLPSNARKIALKDIYRGKPLLLEQ